MCDFCNENHHVHEHEDFTGLQICKICIAPVFLICAICIDISDTLKFLLFIAAYLIAGGDILLKAFKNIIKGKIFDENFLMGLATLGAFAIKEYPEAVMVMLLYRIGEYFQHRAVEKSKKSITELMDIRPDYANIEESGGLIKKSPEDIKINDIIIVQTGEKIPLDGIVVDGSASVDTSALTGESVPKQLKIGDDAFSGYINKDGFLKIKVTKLFKQSTVSKILELVEHASSKKAQAENFITKFARYYTPAVVFGAVILAVVPPFVTGGSFEIWFQRALTFLVISCPCALVISVPLGFFAGLGAASKCGILVKGSNYLEALSKPDTVVFDKTGTLTKGIFKVSKIFPANGFERDELLKLMAYAENYSTHPIAISLKEAYGKNINTDDLKNITEIAGNGIKAVIKNDTILAGNEKLMQEFNIEYMPYTASGTVIYAAKNNQFMGHIVISDEIKEDSYRAAEQLKKLGIKTFMLTGDNEDTAKNVSEKLGIDKHYSGLLPSEKIEKLEEIITGKQKGKSVIFIGDGINDAPVLTRADVGIAMGCLGSDAAIEAADAVIMDDKPSKIVAAVNISKKTMRIVKQNIIFALGVKVLFLILGALGFMTMWGAVFADVGVALLAVLNSLRALQYKNV